MGSMQKKERTVLLLVASFYCFGLVFHVIDLTFPWMLRLTPLVLAGIGALMIIPALREGGRKLVIWSVLLFLVTFVLEAVGTATGMIFGAYTYGTVLGPMLFDVPLIIGFNWTIIVMGVSAAVFARISNPLAGALLVAAVCTFFDFIMEPVAMALGYWNWSGGTIPLQNYAAWFLIAFAGALGWKIFGVRSSHPFPQWYVPVQLFFFLGLQLFVIP
jgi:bisanhydrobacterioruberin hydratase